MMECPPPSAPLSVCMKYVKYIEYTIFMNSFSVEGKYVSQGKLGVAVLGNHTAQDVST